MKKILVLLLVVFSTSVLAACSSSKSPLLISKYYEAISGGNNAIEIYNTSSKSVKLSDYKLEIHINGFSDNLITIPLSGEIKGNDYFVISRDSASNQDLIDISDMQSEDLVFNGNDPVLLKKGKTTIDAIGTPGFNADFGTNLALVRKVDQMKARKTFVYSDFVMYHAESFQLLKTTEGILLEEELLKGPKLTQADYDKPFVDPNDANLGGGGVIEVTLASTGDGDTANFRIEDNIVSGELIIIPFGVHRVRFYYIDTPEVIPGQEKPFGKPASLFTSNILNGTKIELQSIEGQALKDTFGRYLFNVWVDGNLVSHFVIKNGLSKAASDYVQQYRSVLYYGFLKNAEHYAEANGFALHGEVDPCWNYETNKLKPGTCYYDLTFR
ncbi:conserved hypothetical protein [Paracholeplasma brassicae]|uniref:Uncharacterized protein n=1 Tax=Acholeplasma brassicae TaxID=61635 RepID=U4KTH1_9MOLU|nr:lamin tail domain-containing protein [Paracholeplasma brassicae]CCV66679.1 conserved hypothetical protein [Paracholeplasma brassicae]